MVNIEVVGTKGGVADSLPLDEGWEFLALLYMGCDSLSDLVFWSFGRKPQDLVPRPHEVDVDPVRHSSWVCLGSLVTSP